MRVRFAHVVSLLALPALALAQGQQRMPRGTVSATVGGKKVTIDYGRPQLKGRAMAELLKQLPPDSIWRAGENEVTTLTAEGDFMIGGKKVPAGKYSVYIHAPETGDWSLVLNTDPGTALKNLWAQAPPNVADHLWPRLDGYDKVKDKEVVRAAMKSGSVAAPVEAFTIAAQPAKDGATLDLSWGDRSWSLELKPAK